MNITRNIEIIDLALYLKKQKLLIVADFHIGFEEALNEQGVLVPRFQFKDLVQRLEGILEKMKKEKKQIDTIIINGDVKHEFGKISEQEWRETLKLIDFLAKQCRKLYLIKGNHDKILGPIARKRNIEVIDDYVVDDILIAHGDKLKDSKLKNKKKIKTIIIGHEHPAVLMQQGARREKFKCFLVGKYKSRKLIVQPSFNLVVEGADVLHEKRLSPFIKGYDYKVFVVGDKVYDFGKLEKLNEESKNN